MAEQDPPRLVLFDLGGVMVRLPERREDAAASAGVALPAIDDAGWARWGEAVMAYEVGRLDTPGFFAAAAAISGLSVDDHLQLHRSWLVEPYPGVHELVAELHAAGVALGCLSNTNAEHWAMMHDRASHACLPLHDMAHRFASHEIGAAKPDAAIYEHVERITALPGEAIAFFDDRPENVDAAAARGWRAHRVDPTGDPPKQVRRVLSGYGYPL